MTKNDAVEINNKNYESTKKALEAYEKKTRICASARKFSWRTPRTDSLQGE